MNQGKYGTFWGCVLIVLLIVLFSLPGCSSVPVALPEESKKADIDQNLLVNCAPLLELKSGVDEVMIDYQQALYLQYVACALNNASLVRLVRKTFNLEQ